MKSYYLIPLLAIAIMVGCSESKEKSADNKDYTEALEGVWEMTASYNYDENGDSTEVDRRGHRQIKIYSDGYVMWSRTVPVDSTQWYGWGGYSGKDGNLNEWIEYGSNAFMTVINPDDPFNFKLNMTESSFIQTNLDSLGKPISSEHYKLLSERTSGEEAEDEEEIGDSIDGVWEMAKLENGNPYGDVMEVDRTGYRQIKMYKDGFVMWSQQVPADSTEWFGYGKYSSEGGLLTEWMEFGSHAFNALIGPDPFVQDLIVDPESYVQTMQDSAGNIQYVEYYNKISKPDTDGEDHNEGDHTN